MFVLALEEFSGRLPVQLSRPRLRNGRQGECLGAQMQVVFFVFFETGLSEEVMAEKKDHMTGV